MGVVEGDEGERQSVPSHGRASEHQEEAREALADGKGRGGCHVRTLTRLMELKV